MLWWFERAGRHTRVEVLQLATDEYELRVIDAEPDGVTPRAASTVAGVGPGHRPLPLRRTSPALSTCTVTVGTTS
jgi:hypothetical protein